MRCTGFAVFVLVACLQSYLVQAADMPNFPDRCNIFAFDLAQKLEAPGQRNLLVSPPSIEIALGMVYAGANGETAEAMSRALGIDGTSRDAAIAELASLQVALQNPGKGVTLKVANAAWIDDSIRLNQKFSNDLAETFKTKLESARFKDSTTVSRINDWVSNATEGKISRFLENPPSPPMFLANAVYFHAQWSSPFQKQLTHEQAFYPADGSKMTVEMMRQNASFPYAKGAGYTVVALPYVENRFAMYCFLPDQSVEALVEELKRSSWATLAGTLHLTRGSVALPKFKVEYSAGLTQALSGLGMGIAFDPHRAQFTRMIDGPQKLYIGGVLHKAFLEVDEAGSTAAAATGIQMRPTAMMRPSEEFNLVFDRPFIAAIADQKSGTIIFLGMIGAPKE
jgi:serine protease inhibitor